LCAPCAADAAARFDRDGWPRPPWSVEPDAGAVVVGADGLRHGGRISRQLPRNLAQLAAFCERRGASAVWVHESAFAGLGWPAELPHLAPGAGHPSPFFDETGPYCCTYPAPPGLIHYSRWWVRGGHGVDLHVPAYSAAAPRPFRSPFAGAETVEQLGWAVDLYGEATRGALPWRGGGPKTSDDYLRRHYSRRRTLRPTAVAPPFADGAASGQYGEHDMRWVRQPVGDETKARRLMVFDANALYLGAASTLSLPVGEVEHRDRWPELRETTPGYWLVEPPAWAGPGPCPWGAPDDTARWVTTPTAWLLRQLAGVEPLEAWVWPEHHQFLRPWYETVRDARARAAEVGGPALAAVKTVYKAGLGRLQSDLRSGGTAADPLYQPYWGQAVIAAARCNLHRRIAQLGAEPVAVQVDAVYFLTNRTSPAHFAGAVGLPLGDGLGEFKPKGRPMRRSGPRARAVIMAAASRPERAFWGLDAAVGEPWATPAPSGAMAAAVES
jgi:hypothetical protein